MRNDNPTNSHEKGKKARERKERYARTLVLWKKSYRLCTIRTRVVFATEVVAPDVSLFILCICFFIITIIIITIITDFYVSGNIFIFV